MIPKKITRLTMPNASKYRQRLYVGAKTIQGSNFGNLSKIRRRSFFSFAHLQLGTQIAKRSPKEIFTLMRQSNLFIRFVPSLIMGWICSLTITQAQPVLTVGPTTEILEFNPSIQFIFSEPMDSNSIDLTWSGNIDASKFECSWLQSFPGLPVIILQCQYQGGLPEGVEVTYTLNAGNSGVMKSVSGQALAETSGTFRTPGGGGDNGGGVVIPPVEENCADDPVNTREDGALYLFRNLEFQQTGSALSDHPDRPHGVVGGLTIPPILGNANFDSLTLVKPNGSQENLIQLENPLASDWFILSTQPLPNIAPPVFSDVSSLDESYPGGRYQFTGPSNRGNVNVSIQMGSLSAVSDPLFTGLENIPHNNLSQAWTLQWNAATPLTVNTHVSMAIEDLNGNRVFQAPDRCENIELPPSATSINIPAGTLMNGQGYRVSLNFFTLTDQGQTLAFGIQQYAGVGKRTEMLIGPGSTNPQPVELAFTNISPDANGIITLTVSGTLNATTPSVMIEQTTDLETWTPFSEVTLDMLQQGGGSTEIQDLTSRFIPNKIYRIP